jgi:aspartyl-tRNA(Asn)/glutamyl-tRNA(Gln) amidotransferase subunit A
MNDELAYLSIAETARRMRAGELSPVALTEAYLERIAALDAQLHSYITVTGDLAREQAQRAEAEMRRGAWRGPLHGIPFGLKDMFETRGIRTTAHSKVLADHVPPHDAHAVRRLYDAGAVLLGKQASHEFAHGGPSFDLPWPPARNPWNTAHYTGSSSTGSGAAVAGGLAAFALGTDTGGSVRTPAWLCGVVGFKPTFGVVGRSGVIPFSPSCDHVGPLARTVEDAALVLQAIAGRDPGDPGSTTRPVPEYTRDLRAGIAGLRIGVLRHHFEEDVRVRSLHDYYAVRIMLTESELFARHQHRLRQQAGDYGQHFLARALAAALFTSADYLAAQRERRRIIAEMQPVYARYDALVTAGSGPAAHLDSHRSIGAKQKWSTPSMGTMFSVTGAPALALPCGFSSKALPLGLQIAGRPHEDAMVLRIGHAYEQATRWHQRHPQLEPGAEAAPIDTSHAAPPAVDLDAAMTAQVQAAVRHAGLALDEAQLALLCEAAPHALAMAARLPRDLPFAAEEAAVFRLDPLLAEE